MSRKLFCIFLAVLLLAAGCAAGDPQQDTKETQPQQFSDDPAIAAVWVNGGETPDGQDYVETMSLLTDGAAMITIEYQDSFQTLTGTYTALQGVLTVSIDADEPYQEIYRYELDANVLTLFDNDKPVIFRRSD